MRHHVEADDFQGACFTSLAHREPDHVPCWLGASPEWKGMAREYLGLPDDESLLVYLGDDFRRVYSSYAGPQARIRRPI